VNIPRKLCRLLTLGRHWFQFYPEQKAYVRCRLCGKYPPNMWDWYDSARIKSKNVVKWINKRRKRCGLQPLQ
jgi:hypothetical protein